MANSGFKPRQFGGAKFFSKILNLGIDNFILEVYNIGVERARNKSKEEKTMSRAQGDSYKTYTNHELNAYRARLDAKILELEQREKKWHRIGEGWILTEKKNKLANPNGGWKWNGWEVRGQEYAIWVFAGNCVKEINGEMCSDGWCEASWFFEGGEEARIAANAAFEEAKVIAKDLKVSSRVENKR